MNKVILYGNLARDPETKVVNAKGRDVTVCNLVLAVGRSFKKSDGSTSKETCFVPLEMWDTAAETATKYLSKGSPLLVEGMLKEHRWETDDGQKRSRMLVRVTHFQMMGRNRNDNPNQD